MWASHSAVRTMQRVANSKFNRQLLVQLFRVSREENTGKVGEVLNRVEGDEDLAWEGLRHAAISYVSSLAEKPNHGLLNSAPAQ